jgi:hypothetical protein
VGIAGRVTGLITGGIAGVVTIPKTASELVISSTAVLIALIGVAGKRVTVIRVAGITVVVAIGVVSTAVGCVCA